MGTLKSKSSGQREAGIQTSADLEERMSLYAGRCYIMQSWQILIPKYR